MFWGLIMEPNKRYTQTVEKAFHLSMASLDASTASPYLVQVMICYDDRNYLLCTLEKGSIWQVPLDLNFQEGTKIAFTCNGDGHVHLTGYLIPDDEELDDLDDLEEDEDEEEDEDIPTLVSSKKRKANSPQEKNSLKRAKQAKVQLDEDEDDESDSDNEGGELDLEDDSDDDLDGEEEEDDDEDEDESDEDDEEDEEEEEIEKPVKPSKKQKQKQNQQNHQQNQQPSQQQNKKEKNKMVNGKESASEKEQGKQKKNKDNSKTEDKPEQPQQQQQKRKTIEGGVQIEELKAGDGPVAKSGKFVSVYYVGKLKNGKKFDQTQQGDGFKFRLGKGEVIKGWDVGIVGMKVGAKRRIVIPPNMAYGAKGSPPVIPPNSTLTFEVELKAIH